MLQGTVTEFMQDMSERLKALETLQVGSQESGARHGVIPADDESGWMKDVLIGVLQKVDEL